MGNRKIFEIKRCNWDCPLHSRCAHDDEPCNFYDEIDPDYAMKPKDKKPKYCKVKRVIVEEAS